MNQKNTTNSRIIGFHLDMKVAQYRTEYLKELWPRLANLGYTHVFFEIEDKVRLETIRGAEWCEAFSKAEFSDILKTARNHGLVPVPLIQTLGHLEFLLSHPPYQAWREMRNNAYMICPSNAEAVRHLLRYIDEVGELFANPPFIHLGADETYYLGGCPSCRKKVKAASKSAVFMEHLNKLANHSLKRGWRPLAWADHALKYPEKIERLNREIILVDWDYWSTEKNPPNLLYWKEHKQLPANRLPGEFLKNEGRFALDERGKIRSWFYTDYLRAKGFDVIVAPAMRCGGDHVFAPCLEHMANVTGAAMRLTREPAPLGMLVTSWAVRLNHLETQWPGFAIPQAVSDCGEVDSWRDLREYISRKILGKNCPEFFDAWKKIGTAFAFAQSSSGMESATWYYGQTDSVPWMLEQWRKDGRLKAQVGNLQKLKTGYRRGQEILNAMNRKIPAGNRCLRYWKIATRAILHKADTFELFAKARKGKTDKNKAADLLLAEEALRDEYRSLLNETYAPASVEREIAMIFGSSLRHLMRLAM